MMNQSDYEHLLLSQAKAKRARRRQFEATREPGHLRVWFQEHGDPSVSDELGIVTFQQLMRSYKHSCHASCCVIDAYEKRRSSRKQRFEARRELKRLEAGGEP